MAQGDDRRVESQRLPAELEVAFSRQPRAREIFEQMAASHQREYVTWVREARRADTRERRAAQTIMRLLDASP